MYDNIYNVESQIYSGLTPEPFGSRFLVQFWTPRPGRFGFLTEPGLFQLVRDPPGPVGKSKKVGIFIFCHRL